MDRIMGMVKDLSLGDLEKVADLLPLLKKRAQLEEQINSVWSEGSKAAPIAKPVPVVAQASHSAPSAPKKALRRASPKKMAPKSVAPAPEPPKPMPPKRAIPKPTAAAPVAAAGNVKDVSNMQVAVDFLKSQGKSATTAEIMDAVAKAKRFELTDEKKNVLKSSIYSCKRLRKTGPGKFGLAK